ncbi:MAG: hypothetical protein K8R68_06670 [Bacteroidales bacterium]|nr:hypothetical protein [Bacteroidales bacterium]
MKNTNKKLNGKIKVIKYTFTDGNITKYSGINAVKFGTENFIDTLELILLAANY